MSISTHTSTWQSRTKQQLLDDIEAIIETRDRAIARAERAEAERDEAVAKVARGLALADAADAEVEAANAEIDPVTGRRSTMVSFVLTTDLRAALDTPATDEGGEGA
jgi:uncharacterized coiled-coil DUF342 family protein